VNTQYNYERTIYGSESNDIDIAIAGEALISQGLKAYPVRDFAPVSLVSRAPNVLVVHPSLPVKSVDELIALGTGRESSTTAPADRVPRIISREHCSRP
jgi:hypothetical protein